MHPFSTENAASQSATDLRAASDGDTDPSLGASLGLDVKL